MFEDLIAEDKIKAIVGEGQRFGRGLDEYGLPDRPIGGSSPGVAAGQNAKRSPVPHGWLLFLNDLQASTFTRRPTDHIGDEPPGYPSRLNLLGYPAFVMDCEAGRRDGKRASPAGFAIPAIVLVAG